MKPHLQKQLFFFAAVVFAALLADSCRKKANPTPSNAKFTGCRVAQIIENGTATNGTTYSFTYNNDGRVSTIKFQGGGDSFVKTITYKTNCIIVITKDNGSVSAKDSLLLDAQKRVILIDHYNYNGSPPPNLMYDQYNYDTSGNLVTIVSHYYSTVSSQNFQWANGDIEWNTGGTDFYTYVYDTSLYNIGNISARFSDLENYGIGIYTPRHLCSMAIMDNSDTTNYTYTRDADGKITSSKRIFPGNYINTTAITYNCE